MWTDKPTFHAAPAPPAGVAVFVLFLPVAVLSLLWGCERRSDGPAGGPGATDVRIDADLSPEPPTIGPATVKVTVTDASGQPIEGARIDVEGNMNHAGMVPVLASASGGSGGRYIVPMEFTMGGDWFILIDVTLPNGRTVQHRIDTRVVRAD